MKIYRVKGDFDYAWINYSDDGIGLLLVHAVNDEAEIDRTKPIRLEVSSPEEGWIETDCPYLPSAGAILFSDRTIDAAGSMLTSAGYLLDTLLDVDKRYKIFICTNQIDALDQERSDLTRFRSGNVWDVLRFELNAELLQDTDVFRLKHQRASLFVSDRFVRMVEQYDLTGFVFKEIWSSDTGGVTLQPDVIPVERVPGEFAKRAAVKRKALRKLLVERG